MVASRLLYILLLFAVVPFAASAWWPGARVAGLAYDMVLLLVLIVDYRLTQRPQFLSAVRETADRLSIGRSNEVVIEVFNQGASRLACHLKDDRPSGIESDVDEFAFSLPAGGKATVAYHLEPKRRGSYQFGNINLRYVSFLKLFHRTKIVAASQPVKVFSDLKALHELSLKLSHSSELGEMTRRKLGQGTEFASLREYMVGDDVRSIDWRATARRDRPVVRTYEEEQEQVLMVLIDAGRMMVSDLEGLSRFDHALNAGLSLALAGLSRNDQVGFGVFADKPLLYLPPRRGKAHFKRILEAVFDIQAKTVEPDYVGMLSYFASAQKGRSLMVVITDLTDPTGSQTLLAGLASLSPHHLPFCVTLKDRQVDRVAGRPAPTAEDVYRRAVAVDLLGQRELALSVLVRRGCLVLDCPPQELSTALVDRYLEIKARGRL